ncbi:putative type VI secretion system effector [Acinetobacter courvalinii]|uniref:putative type VI secretion system effector n=1 Tax=Acinetobacter courvalinii TaxID=280147 RepID=UPI002899DBC9|nr:putative type VI secretion system effector [Acinetobacter courvalinii]
MIKIEGRVRNLQIEDSKIHPLKNIEKQAVGSAMLGTLASSSALMTNAPIMLMAARGIDAKTFTCVVNGYKVIGQFTTVQFKDNDPLILVISEEKEQERHLAYSILDPRLGLLYMLYEMGRSLKKSYKNIWQQVFIWSISASVIFSGLFFIFDIFSGKEILHFSYLIESIKLFILIFFALLVFFSVFMNLIFRKCFTQSAELSEKIFSILGFKNVDEQDFYNNFIIKDGVHISVMEYRKNLKGQDPYPEDYFDKKKG